MVRAFRGVEVARADEHRKRDIGAVPAGEALEGGAQRSAVFDEACLGERPA